MDVLFVSWDFRAPPTAQQLADAIVSFGTGPIYVAPVDAGTDDHILALADEPITCDLARRLWLQ
jgi:hypothetical protein